MYNNTIIAERGKTMQNILDKVKRNGYSFEGKVPENHMMPDGKYRLGNGGSWTDGFYVGVFNMCYALSGDKDFLELAARYDEMLDRRIENTDEINEKYNYLKLDHDVGMIFLPANGFRYRLNGNEKDKETLIKAAAVLACRFNEKGGFIRAWDTWKWDKDEQFIEEKKGKVIIDSMMNIPLLFQVAEITGDKSYYEIAERHANTVADNIVRSDYSTYHSFNFNHKTGEPVCGRTVQGYSDESCWSRGQAWAVYGFALAYKYTKNERFIEVAKNTAEYFMSHLSPVDMPTWDFSAASLAFAPWDSAASAICASGLLEIYALTKDEKYKAYAERLLKALEKFASTEGYDDCQPLFLHGVVGSAYRDDDPNKLVNRSIGQALVYTDYFYLECKLKLRGEETKVF